MKKRIISIEGLDCAGKTTLINLVCKKINAKKISNPFDHKVGKTIRTKLVNFKFDLKASAMMHSAINLHLYDKATSSEFEVIIFDRFFVSTLVYNCDSEEYEKIVLDIHDECIIQKHILIDIDFDTFVKRLNSRPHKDYHEINAFNNFNSLRARFHDIMNKYLDSNSFKVIDNIEDGMDVLQKKSEEIIDLIYR